MDAIADKERERISKYAQLLYECGIPSVYSSKVREQAKQSKIPEEDVRNIFESANIKVADSNIKEWLPDLISDADMKTLTEAISLLKLQKDRDKTDFSKVNNLYEFIAYICEDLPYAGTYKNKPAGELLTLVESKIGNYVRGTTDYSHACQTLCSNAKNKIFDSEAHSRAYKNSLIYESLKAEMGDALRLMSNTDLKSAFFAETIINKIISRGFNGNEAVAVYNKLSALVNDPYIPEKPVITIKCEKCGYLNRFNTVEEAESGKCVCGNELFTLCPSCGKATPSSSDYCIYCDFLVAGVKNFPIYYQSAIDALTITDFTGAQLQFSNAKRANPNDSRISGLEKRINEELSVYEKPTEEIKKLISANMFRTALKVLNGIRQEYPQLNLSSYENRISSVLQRLDKLFSDSKNGSESRQIEVCEQILAECSDYEEAKRFLLSKPPKPCAGIECVCDGKNAALNIRWQPSADNNISYTLLRKEGGVPAGPSDPGAEILAADTNQLFFTDTTAFPGVEYFYAVFVSRYNVYSLGVFVRALLIQDISNCKYSEDITGGIMISWDMPVNCVQVRIFKRENGIPTDNGSCELIYEGTGLRYTDSTAKSGFTYGYLIQAAYTVPTGTVYSNGIAFTYRIAEKLSPFTIAVSSIGLNVCVSWEGLGDLYTVRIVELAPGVQLLKDSIIKTADIGKYGDTVVSVPASAGCVTFKIEENRYTDITAFAFLSSEAISSNTGSVNTYLPVIPQSDDVTVDGSIIAMKLKEPLLPNAKYIYYGLKTDKPYLTEPQELNRRLRVSTDFISKHRNEIHINNSSGICGTCYLTLYTEYDINGTAVLSSPYNTKIKIPMRINVTYSAKAKRNKNSVEVCIEAEVIKGSTATLPPFKLINTGNKTVIAVTDSIPVKNNVCSYKKVLENAVLPAGKVRVKLLPEDESWLDDMIFFTAKRFDGEI